MNPKNGERYQNRLTPLSRFRDNVFNFCTVLVETIVHDSTAQNFDAISCYSLLVVFDSDKHGFRSEEQRLKMYAS